MRRRQCLGSTALLADVVLSATMARAEAATARHRVLGSDENYYQGSYGAYASSWGAPLEPVPLVEGRDFTNALVIDPARFPGGTDMTWQWPDRPPTRSGVYGYLHIYRGNYDGGIPPDRIKPVRVSDLKVFRQEIAFAHHDGPSDGFNLLNEFWLTRKEGDHADKAFEIGFMLHTNTRTSETVSRAEPLGAYADTFGQAWSVVKLGGPVPYIIFVPEGHQDFQGKLDAKHALEYLRSKAVITGVEWINGVALGVEPHFGAGRLTVDDWKAEFH